MGMQMAMSRNIATAADIGATRLAQASITCATAAMKHADVQAHHHRHPHPRPLSRSLAFQLAVLTSSRWWSALPSLLCAAWDGRRTK